MRKTNSIASKNALRIPTLKVLLIHLCVTAIPSIRSILRFRTTYRPGKNISSSFSSWNFSWAHGYVLCTYSGKLRYYTTYYARCCVPK